MKNTTHPITRLWQYAKPQRTQIIIATLFSVLNKLFDLAPPLLIGAAVDIVVNREDAFIAQYGITDVNTQLWVIAILTAFIWGGESLFEYLFSLAWRNIAQALQHNLRLDAYGHVQGLEMAYFEDQSTGGLIAILNDDINQLERFLDSGANDIIQLITTLITTGATFFILAPSVAWLAVLPLPIIAWASLYWQNLLAPRYVAVREQVGNLSSQLVNNIGGIATIKSYTAEAHEVARIRQESDAYQQTNRQAIKLSAAFVPLLRMVIMAGFISILVGGGQLALSGEMNVGIYSVLVFLTQRLLWPITRLGTTLDLYQRAVASTQRVLDLLDTRPGILTGPTSLPLTQVQGQVVFDNVSFQYANGFEVVHDLSLVIPAGTTAAIVGATGSGKSTLVKLLLRYYDIQTGHIRLDGHDLPTLQTSDLRRAIGFVSQDVFLFHGTVRENIAYGTFEASLDDIIASAKTAEAHDFISQLPDGYDTIVGERGQKLSGGQRQRISIARAVLKDPPVLILDEATSAVDNETEAAIQRSLERIVVNRTTLVIAHRLSTVRNAHQIFVLDSGRVAEQGRHEDLIAQNGLYSALWRVQTGEQG